MSKRLVVAPLDIVKPRRVKVRALRVRPSSLALPSIIPFAGLNQPETRVYQALTELKVRFTTQAKFLGGDVLGGARLDFYLPDYAIDLEYSGPFHATTSGLGRDLLRDITVRSAGLRRVVLKETDLPNLKQRILELIGRPL